MKVSIPQFQQWASQQINASNNILEKFADDLKSTPYVAMYWSTSSFEAAAIVNHLTPILEELKSPDFSLDQYSINVRKDLVTLSSSLAVTSSASANLAELAHKAVLAKVLAVLDLGLWEAR